MTAEIDRLNRLIVMTQVIRGLAIKRGDTHRAHKASQDIKRWTRERTQCQNANQ